MGYKVGDWVVIEFYPGHPHLCMISKKEDDRWLCIGPHLFTKTKEHNMRYAGYRDIQRTYERLDPTNIRWRNLLQETFPSLRVIEVK